MIITRKITIYVSEQDKERKKEYFEMLYKWRNMIRTAANEVVSYLYSVDTIKYYKFITEDSKIQMGVLGAKGEPVKEL